MLLPWESVWLTQRHPLIGGGTASTHLEYFRQDTLKFLADCQAAPVHFPVAKKVVSLLQIKTVIQPQY